MLIITSHKLLSYELNTFDLFPSCSVQDLGETIPYRRLIIAIRLFSFFLIIQPSVS